MTNSERSAIAEWFGKTAEIARRKLGEGDLLITFPLSAEMIYRFETARAFIRPLWKDELEAFAAGSGSAELQDALSALKAERETAGEPLSTDQMQAVIDLLCQYGVETAKWVKLLRGSDAAFERKLSEIWEGSA